MSVTDECPWDPAAVYTGENKSSESVCSHSHTAASSAHRRGESCGFMGKAAVRFVGQLWDVAAASGRISKGAV